MKILMFNYEYPPLGGGGGVFNKQLAEELVKQRHAVTVVTSLFKSQQPHEKINGVQVIRVPILMRSDQNAANHVSMLTYFPTSFFYGKKILRKEDYDIIHTFFAIPTGPSAVLLSKLFKTPHILSLLGGDIYDPSKKLSPHDTPGLHYTVKKVMESSDKVIALSSDIQARAIRHYEPSQKIDLIHLGIPEPVFQPVVRGDFGYTGKDIVLVTVGRLVRRKGLEELFHSIKKINNPNVKLAVIGDGPERNNLLELRTDLGLENQITLFGYIDNETKFQLLNISDVYASSSQHEGFGIVFLEAMAAGLPVICFDKGGQADFLKDNETGYLVRYGNYEAFNAKLQRLCNMTEERNRFSRFNKEYVQKFYIQRCAEQYVNAYRELIDGQRNTGR